MLPFLTFSGGTRRVLRAPAEVSGKFMTSADLRDRTTPRARHRILRNTRKLWPAESRLEGWVPSLFGAAPGGPRASEERAQVMAAESRLEGWDPPLFGARVRRPLRLAGNTRKESDVIQIIWRPLRDSNPQWGSPGSEMCRRAPDHRRDLARSGSDGQQ